MYVPPKSKVAPRPEVTAAKVKSFTLGFLKVFSVIFAMVFAIVLVYSLVQRWQNSPRFLISNYKFLGTHTVSQTDLLRRAKLNYGVSIYDLDHLSIEEDMLTHPNVEKVEIEREYPTGLIIKVKERTAIALLVDESGEVLPVDRHGHIMTKEAMDEAVGLPKIKNSEEVVVPGRVCRNEGTLSTLHYLWVIANSAETQFLTIREISLADKDSVDMTTESVDHLLLGVNYSNDAVAKVFKVLKTLRQQRRNPAKIDARYEDVAVVCKYL